MAADIQCQLEVTNIKNVQELLTDIRIEPAKSKEIQQGLTNAGNYLIGKGKIRLRQRMISGPQGVTGNLLRAFKKTIKKKNAGVLTGFRGGKGGGSHSWLIDKGTKERRGPRGRVKPNKFWSDTRQTDTPKAMEKILDGIGLAMNKIRKRN